MGFLRRCYDFLFEDLFKYKGLGACGKNVVIPDGFKIFGKSKVIPHRKVGAILPEVI